MYVLTYNMSLDYSTVTQLILGCVSVLYRYDTCDIIAHVLYSEEHVVWYIYVAQIPFNVWYTVVFNIEYEIRKLLE